MFETKLAHEVLCSHKEREKVTFQMMIVGEKIVMAVNDLFCFD